VPQPDGENEEPFGEKEMKLFTVSIQEDGKYTKYAYRGHDGIDWICADPDKTTCIYLNEKAVNEALRHPDALKPGTTVRTHGFELECCSEQIINIPEDEDQHLTDAEKSMVESLWPKVDWEITVWRASQREFDLKIGGKCRVPDAGLDHAFGAWLPLMAISQLNWPKFADESDYPNMVENGDWSGIRDSDTTKIWAMFHKHVIGLG